jgi:hypothetical protein
MWGEQIDQDIGFDFFDDTFGILGSVSDESGAAFMIFRYRLEVPVVDIDNGDMMGCVPEQMLDAWFRYTPGSQYENFFHNKHLP